MENQTPATPASTGTGLSGLQIALIAIAIISIGAIFLWPSLSKLMGGSPTAADLNAGANSSLPPATAPPASALGGDGKLNSSIVPADAVELRVSKKKEFGRYNEKIPDYNSYYSKAFSIVGDNRDDAQKKANEINYNVAAVTGFFKGMNIAANAENVILWKDYIRDYVDSENKLYAWEITKVGQFLGKATI